MASQILSVDPGNSQRLKLNRHLIRNILAPKNVHKLKVTIISIAGPYRKGKSFLLNFFIRYLRRNGSSDWLHTDVQQVLEGFESTDGACEGTTGVWLWPEPFIIDDVAVFLMDTQGLFNLTQSDQANTTILALTTMVSTVTIYNLQGELQKNDLDFLHFSTEYGQSALRSKESYGAGKLVVLVRDWVHKTYQCGFAGGGHYIDNLLRDQSAQVGESLRTNFADITCFLMPKHVTGRRQTLFSRRLDQLDKEFVSCLGEFIPEIVVGVIENAILQTGPEVFLRFVMCFRALEDMAPVSDRIVLQMMLDEKIAYELAVNEYCKSMCTIIGGDGVLVDPKLLKEAHDNAMGRVVKGFQSRARMGGNVGGAASVEQLERDLELLGRNFASINERVHFGQIRRKIVAGFASSGVTGVLRAIAGCDAAIVVPCVCLVVSVGLIAVGVAVFVVPSVTVSHGILSTLLTSAASWMSELVRTRVLGRGNVQPRIKERDLEINNCRYNWRNLKHWVIYVLVVVVVFLLMNKFEISNTVSLIMGGIIIGVFSIGCYNRLRKDIKSS